MQSRESARQATNIILGMDICDVSQLFSEYKTKMGITESSKEAYISFSPAKPDKSKPDFYEQSLKCVIHDMISQVKRNSNDDIDDLKRALLAGDDQNVARITDRIRERKTFEVAVIKRYLNLLTTVTPSNACLEPVKGGPDLLAIFNFDHKKFKDSLLSDFVKLGEILVANKMYPESCFLGDTQYKKKVESLHEKVTNKYKSLGRDNVMFALTSVAVALTALIIAAFPPLTVMFAFDLTKKSKDSKNDRDCVAIAKNVTTLFSHVTGATRKEVQKTYDTSELKEATNAVMNIVVLDGAPKKSK